MPPASSIVIPGIVKLFDSGTLGGTASSLDTGATLSGSYVSLLIRLYARTDETGAVVGVNMTLNGDSGSNYDRNTMRANSGVVSQLTNVAQSNFQGALGAASGSSANVFASSLLEIPQYANTVGYKTILGQSAVFATVGTSTAYYLDQITGLWRSTAAINQVTFVPATGGQHFVAGSRLLVYGL